MNNLHDKAVKLLKQGDSSTMEGAVVLPEIQVRYGKGAIEKVARAVNKSPKTIYRLRNAGEMQLLYDEHGLSPKIPAPYGMFDAAWTMKGKYFSDDKEAALYFYAQMDTAIAEGLSIKDFSKLCGQELRDTINELRDKVDARDKIIAGGWEIMKAVEWAEANVKECPYCLGDIALGHRKECKLDDWLKKAKEILGA